MPIPRSPQTIGDGRPAPAECRTPAVGGRLRRRGESALELVLVLPVLLFITALLINYGTISTWKIRGQVASRNAIWQILWPRTKLAPAPDSWQPPATIDTESTDNFAVLDLPSIHLPVARGPVNGATVNSNLLDPTRGPALGRATVSRQQPMPPQWVTSKYDVQHVLLTDPWTYDTMGLGGNVVRRTKTLYQFAQAPASLSQAFISAVSAVYYGAFQAGLAPLEHEPDFPRFGYGSPDFQPVLQSFCGLDSDQVRSDNVQSLIDRIQGNKKEGIQSVPQVMTQAFLSLYQGAIQKLQGMVDAAPAAQKGQLEQQLAALKAELDPEIAQLQDFMTKLSGS